MRAERRTVSMEGVGEGGMERARTPTYHLCHHGRRAPRRREQGRIKQVIDGDAVGVPRRQVSHNAPTKLVVLRDETKRTRIEGAAKNRFDCVNGPDILPASRSSKMYASRTLGCASAEAMLGGVNVCVKSRG